MKPVTMYEAEDGKQFRAEAQCLEYEQQCEDLAAAKQATYKPGDQAPEGYLAWHEWAEVQHKAGLRQKQCGQCGLWRYPQQLSEHMVRWNGFTARGKPAHQMAPLCLKCEALAANKTPNG